MEKYLLPLLKGKFTQHQMWDLKTISQVKDWLNALYLSPGEEHGVAPENEKQFKMALKDVFDFDYSKGVPIFHEPKQYTLNKVPFLAHSPFDSLAHLLSLTNAPTGATRESFYFPLAANVSRMFGTLGGVNCPARTSIIFEEGASNPMPIVISTDDFVLGSSISWADSTETKRKIQEYRCKWAYSVTGNQIFADPTKSLLNPKGLAKSGQLFGHCAETYGFILKL
ncbi:hypothetical protein MMC28_001926 [Mycoblastus sanguinarius]|nr:hypothetical protein [Mycoblastus sanguinarius]